jgi:hypothetical protein
MASECRERDLLEVWHDDAERVELLHKLWQDAGERESLGNRLSQ